MPSETLSNNISGEFITFMKHEEFALLLENVVKKEDLIEK